LNPKWNGRRRGGRHRQADSLHLEVNQWRCDPPLSIVRRLHLLFYHFQEFLLDYVFELWNDVSVLRIATLKKPHLSNSVWVTKLASVQAFLKTVWSCTASYLTLPIVFFQNRRDGLTRRRLGRRASPQEWRQCPKTQSRLEQTPSSFPRHG
jgi:hypothetical protein